MRGHQAYGRKNNVIIVKRTAKEGNELQVFVNDKHTKPHEAYQPEIIHRLDTKNSCYKKILSAKKPISGKGDQERTKEIGCNAQEKPGRIIKPMHGPDNKLNSPDDQCTNDEYSFAYLF